MSALLLATVVDLGSLGKAALAALVGGLGVTLAFSLGIRGTTRAADLRRSGQGLAAGLALALGLAALALSVAAVAAGLVVMIGS